MNTVATTVMIAGRNRTIISSTLLLYKGSTMYYHYNIITAT